MHNPPGSLDTASITRIKKRRYDVKKVTTTFTAYKNISCHIIFPRDVSNRMVYVLSLVDFQLHKSSCGVSCCCPVRPAHRPMSGCEGEERRGWPSRERRTGENRVGEVEWKSRALRRERKRDAHVNEPRIQNQAGEILHSLVLTWIKSAAHR